MGPFPFTSSARMRITAPVVKTVNPALVALALALGLPFPFRAGREGTKS